MFRKKEYLEAKIYHAFYAFESLTVRPASSIVCGVCGIIPDVLFGKYSTEFCIIILLFSITLGQIRVKIILIKFCKYIK